MSLFSLTGSVVLHIDSYASYLLSMDLHIKLSLCPQPLDGRWMLEQGLVPRERSRTLPAKSDGLVHSKRPYVAPIESAFQKFLQRDRTFQSLLTIGLGSQRGGLALGSRVGWHAC
jgi:hypothetical protein